MAKIRIRFDELKAAALSDNGSDVRQHVTLSTLARFDGVRRIAGHAPAWVFRNLPRADALAALVIRAEHRQHVADGAAALSLATRAGVLRGVLTGVSLRDIALHGDVATAVLDTPAGRAEDAMRFRYETGGWKADLSDYLDTAAGRLEKADELTAIEWELASLRTG